MSITNIVTSNVNRIYAARENPNLYPENLNIEPEVRLGMAFSPFSVTEGMLTSIWGEAGSVAARQLFNKTYSFPPKVVIAGEQLAEKLAIAIKWGSGAFAALGTSMAIFGCSENSYGENSLPTGITQMIVEFEGKYNH